MWLMAALSDTTQILLVVAGAVLGLLLALLVQPLLQGSSRAHARCEPRQRQRTLRERTVGLSAVG
jgi:hypothetical protein